MLFLRRKISTTGETIPTIGKKITNIGFVSTRLQGTDGVSLETEKWNSVLEKMGYKCFFFAGLSDWDRQKTMVVPEAYFDHPKIREIQANCFGKFTRSSELTGQIHHFRRRLKDALYNFVKKYAIDLIIPENALAIPMNVPLGLAITEYVVETGIPTIAHHHDFYWERQRFMLNCVPDLLSMAFPPPLPSIQHVVINTPAEREVSRRTGLSPRIIPNVHDFATPAPLIDEYTKDIRVDLGLEKDDILFLQPTRIVARKGIEHAIEVLNRLKNPKAKLVITHFGGDEGSAYEERVRSYASIMNVPLIIKPEIIGKERGVTPDGKKVYKLWDIYPHADFVMYASTYEGFGNALLETMYFKKPLFVNRYSNYQMDIEPLGFDVVTMDGYVTDKVVNGVQQVLNDPVRKEKMVEKNYQIAAQFFSYDVLAHKLNTLLSEFEGVKQFQYPTPS